MATRALLMICVALGCAVAFTVEPVRTMTLRKASNGEYGFSEDPKDGAFAVSVDYANNLNATGWITLHISGKHSELSGEALWYAAGIAEGRVIQKQIYQHFSNTIMPGTRRSLMPANVTAWVRRHVDFMRSNAEQQQSTSRYWKQVSRVLAQLDGLTQGYNDVAPKTELLTFIDMFFLNFQYEVYDVMMALEISPENEGAKFFKNTMHCSALIKPGKDDFFMAHTTWGSYNEMLRVNKEYELDGLSVTFSGYPGLLHSGDDWYVLSNGLTIQETTNDVYHKELYQFTIPETVSEWMRIIVAHHIGTTGEEWLQTFCRYNSGTYNNQWMVVNMNLYTPGATAAQTPDNMLWIAEQLPGLCPMEDVSYMIRKQGYWNSYNIPFFQTTYVSSGYRMMYEKYGDYFSYTKYARPEIFKRSQGNVTDLEGMQWMIRYNDYTKDPLSLCPGCQNPPYTPWFAIASRGDLVAPGANLGNYSLFLPGPIPFGSLDGKVASYKMLKDGRKGSIVSGPPHAQVPPFQWSKAPKAVQVGPHVGQADLQAWDWIYAKDKK